MENKVQPLKKKWEKPEIICITAGDVQNGAVASFHERNFTPNHTHYKYPGGGGFPATPAFINNYHS